MSVPSAKVCNLSLRPSSVLDEGRKRDGRKFDTTVLSLITATLTDAQSFLQRIRIQLDR